MPRRISLWPVAMQIQTFEGTGITAIPSALRRPRSPERSTPGSPVLRRQFHDDGEAGAFRSGPPDLLDEHCGDEPHRRHQIGAAPL